MKKIKLSYYEFLFACFIEFSQNADVLILEVGLGGRLDAVNALDADIFALTSISRDHQEYLGNNYLNILKEKCGIMRKNQGIYSSLELEYLQNHLNDIAKGLNNEPFDLFANGLLSKNDDFSKRNIRLAKVILENEFFIKTDFVTPEPFIVKKFNSTKYHIISSHNVDGVRKCIQLMPRDKYNFNKVFVFLSDRNLKDASVILKMILKEYCNSHNLNLCVFEHSKAMKKSDLELLAKEVKANLVDDYKKEFSNITQGNILCLGSNYIIGDLSEFIGGHSPGR